jgi:hypothetical protein
VSIVDRIATPSAWQFNTATFSFEPVDLSYGFRAELVSSLSIETSNPVSDVVRFQMPGSFIGTLAPEVRFQAIAKNTDTGVFDRLPDTAPNGNAGLGLPLFMVAPDYPVCAVTPITARPNETVQVAATGLIPGRSVHVILGADFIATGEADDEGNVDVSFRIPFDAPSQRRLVTVGTDGTALTADCLVNVEGAPVTTPIEVPLDIHPGSCPNPIGQKGDGKIPVAIAGTDVVSPEQVDIDTLRLMGVAPIEHQIEDVSTPFEPYLGKASLNDCTKLRKDGLADLTLKFDRNILLDAIFNAYGNVDSGTVIVLEITGNLLDGASMTGEDVIVIP